MTSSAGSDSQRLLIKWFFHYALFLVSLLRGAAAPVPPIVIAPGSIPAAKPGLGILPPIEGTDCAAAQNRLS